MFAGFLQLLLPERDDGRSILQPVSLYRVDAQRNVRAGLELQQEGEVRRRDDRKGFIQGAQVTLERLKVGIVPGFDRVFDPIDGQGFVVAHDLYPILRRSDIGLDRRRAGGGRAAEGLEGVRGMIARAAAVGHDPGRVCRHEAVCPQRQNRK